MKIMQKDTLVASFNIATGEAVVFHNNLMPYDLVLETDSDINVRFNNLDNFNHWCASRVLSLDRMHAKAILNSCGFTQSSTDKDRCQIALKYNCLSLSDYYWVQQDDEDKNWNRINLHNNSLSKVVVDVSLTGKPLTVNNYELIAPDCSTDGVFPKAWVREENGFYLYKGDVNGSVQKEVEASKILQKLGVPVLNYDYASWDNQPAAKCKIFTSPDVSYVTAEHYSYNNDIDPLLDNNFHYMNLATFLIGNSDNHWGNWRFLYNENGIIGLSPIMDFNHAFEAEINSTSSPHQLLGRNCTQLEAAIEALKHVSINIVDLSEFKYGAYVTERIHVLQKTLQRTFNASDDLNDKVGVADSYKSVILSSSDTDTLKQRNVVKRH